MADPIEFSPATQDPREEIQRRLADAPIEHAQALLACYKLIEEAHNAGTLELLRGLVAAQDTVITQASKVLSSPQATTTMRNGLVLMQLLGRMDPEKLNTVLETLTTLTEQVSKKSPPSLLGLLGRANSPNSRRALNVGLAALDAAGKALKK